MALSRSTTADSSRTRRSPFAPASSSNPTEPSGSVEGQYGAPAQKFQPARSKPGISRRAYSRWGVMARQAFRPLILRLRHPDNTVFAKRKRVLLDFTGNCQQYLGVFAVAPQF